MHIKRKKYGAWNNALKYPDVAELADAHDSKSCGKPCGFESHHRDQNKSGWKATFLYERKRWGSKRNMPSLGWFKARLNAGKNSPVDYFCDARASGPTIGTRIKVTLEKKSIIFWKKLKKFQKTIDFFIFIVYNGSEVEESGRKWNTKREVKSFANRRIWAFNWYKR